MEFLQPRSLPDALAAKAERPEAVPIAGGTDVMVELNFDRERPPALLDLSRVGELAAWDRQDGRLRVGAGVTYTRLIDELAGLLPGLALVSRTVGSPQIRNRGTVGGNPDAPYGLRGIGEPPTISSTPAIVAAVHAATGRPLTRVPVRPEHIVGVPAPDGDPERST